MSTENSADCARRITDQPTWRVASETPISPELFGEDHYSTLLYVESRVVDNQGLLDHDHMRCHPQRHPLLAGAGRMAGSFGAADGSRYPTRLRRGPDGQVQQQPEHDDYDCLDDLVAAGWLSVQMPQADERGDVFRDITGKCVALQGEPPVRPSFFTGLDELILGTRARWTLTSRGEQIAAQLRQHQGQGGNLVSFASTLFSRPVETPHNGLNADPAVAPCQRHNEPGPQPTAQPID